MGRRCANLVTFLANLVKSCVGRFACLLLLQYHIGRNDDVAGNTSPLSTTSHRLPFTTVAAREGGGSTSSLRGGSSSNNNHGRRRTSTRIIGGKIAPSTRYTYYTSLRSIRSDGSTGSHFCGGSLLSPQVILTAAHCADGSFTKRIRAVVGRPDFQVKSDGEEINVQSEAVHPMFTRVLDRAPNYDFALLYLERPVDTTAYNIQFLYLNQNQNVPMPGTNLTVLGHGFTTVDKYSLSQKLKELDKYAISNEECANTAIATDGWDAYEDLLTDQMLCAEDSPDDEIEEDSCSGDSGGPLVIKGNDPNGGDDIEVGVVSWGYKCAQEGYPGVYSRISEAYDWIWEELCYNGSGDLAPDYFGCPVIVGSEVESFIPSAKPTEKTPISARPSASTTETTTTTPSPSAIMPSETTQTSASPTAVPSKKTPRSASPSAMPSKKTTPRSASPSAMPSEKMTPRSASPSASTTEIETTLSSPAIVPPETPRPSARPSASTTDIETTLSPSASMPSETPKPSARPSASPTEESTILIFSEITSKPTPAPVVGVSSLEFTLFPTRRAISRLDPTTKQPTRDVSTTMFPTSTKDI